MFKLVLLGLAITILAILPLTAGATQKPQDCEEPEIVIEHVQAQSLPGVIHGDDALVREFQAQALFDEGFSFEEIAAAAGLKAAAAVFSHH